MTYNLEERIESLKTALLAAEEKLDKEEKVGEQAYGTLSDSFKERLEDLRHQKQLMEDHLATLEREKIQSWEKSNLGNDMVKVARSVVDQVSKVLGKFSSHQG